VVQERLETLNCPALWPPPALDLGNGQALASDLTYSLPLPGAVQLTNSALAIAALQILRQQGWSISDRAIVTGIARARWPGRLQWTSWQGRPLLIDGAHNPAAAQALRQFVETLNAPSCHWVIGMLATKDHTEIFKALLRPGDCLHLVPVPEHESADPQALADLALELCPDLKTCQAYPDWQAGLEHAMAEGRREKAEGRREGSLAKDASSPDGPDPGCTCYSNSPLPELEEGQSEGTQPVTILCGSLYLVGAFLSQAQPRL
jgi:dihydrofolate synthase/folylpolyglutamate synthase